MPDADPDADPGADLDADPDAGADPGAVVAAVHAAWVDAFARRDADALAALYAADALFYGSTARLYRGRDGAREYFAELPPRFGRAEYGAMVPVRLGPDVIAASGPVGFTVEEAGQRRTLPYRMTHVLRREAGRWLIAVHHASPVPA